MYGVVKYPIQLEHCNSPPIFRRFYFTFTALEIIYIILCNGLVVNPLIKYINSDSQAFLKSDKSVALCPPLSDFEKAFNS